MPAPRGNREFMTFHAIRISRVLQIVAAVKQPLLKRDMFIQSLLVDDLNFTTACRAYTTFVYRVLYIFIVQLTSRRASRKEIRDDGPSSPSDCLISLDCLLNCGPRCPLANFPINQPRRKSSRSKAVIRYIARNFITTWLQIARPRVTQEMIDRQAEIPLHSVLLVQNAKQLLRRCTHVIISMIISPKNRFHGRYLLFGTTSENPFPK